jgi:hypothetical protein
MTTIEASKAPKIESDDLTLTQVFKDFYVVPNFQREYVWEQENVIKLFDDIYDEFYDADGVQQPSNEYFIGSIVTCMNDVGCYELIDGQQRMTTIYLGLCAIRDHFEQLGHTPQNTLSAAIRDSVLNPATGEESDMQQLNHQLEVTEINQRFRRSMDVHPVIFCCVDSIETRRHIWNAVEDRVEFFCDGRMAAEVLRIVTVADIEGRARYPATMFASDQAYRGGCTAQSTVYCANVAAGVMVHQFTRWLRGMRVDFELGFNLLASELNVA